MTSLSSHQVTFLFERVDGETNRDVFALAKTLENTLTNGCDQSGVKPFGPLRHDIRRDVSKTKNVCLVASFHFSLDAKTIPDSVTTTNADFWLDPMQWHGYKCISAEIGEPIDTLWTFNYVYGNPAYKAAFEKFGKCTVTKTPKGSVLVKYDNVADAKCAVEALHDEIIGDDPNKKLSVDYAARHLRSVTARDPELRQNLPHKGGQYSNPSNNYNNTRQGSSLFRVHSDGDNDRRIAIRDDRQQQHYTDFRNNNNNINNNASEQQQQQYFDQRDYRGSSMQRRDFRDTGSNENMRASPRQVSMRSSRDESRSHDNRRNFSRSPTSRSPSLIQSTGSSTMPTINCDSTVIDVINWIQSMQINEEQKSKMIELVQEERVNGEIFCSFDSIDVLEKQFRVEFFLCDRKTVRTCLQNYRFL